MSEAAFSFVIPVLNEAEALARLLPALQRKFPDVQRVLVDGGSSDESVKLAMPLCDDVLISEPGRARQMNLGASAAEGDYLLFLHADTVPDFDQRALLAWVSAEPRWAFCPVSLSGEGGWLRVIEWSMNRRSRFSGIATGDQMLIVRRELFEAVGCFPCQPLMEDIEICKRLGAHCRADSGPGRVSTSSRRWEERGVLKTMVLMWGLRLAYFSGVGPERLHRIYYGQ